MDVEKIDFNGEPLAPEAGQPEKEEAPKVEAEEPKTEEPVEEPKLEEKAEVEDINALPEWAKARLAKAESDKENYKKGMLKYKKFSLSKEEEPKTEEEEYPEWDEASKKFQKQTLSQAEKRAEAILEKANEKVAVSKFLSDHPEVKDQWDDVVANYLPKNGKETPEDIAKDLERALILTQYEKGTLGKSDAPKKGKEKLAELSTIAKTTAKNLPEGSTLSKGALNLAEKFRVDPKKLAQEDDSSYAEIKF
jgi:hypothetical protein